MVQFYYDQTEAHVAIVIRNSHKKKSMEYIRCIGHYVGGLFSIFSAAPIKKAMFIQKKINGFGH
ncbi:MAG: hypothetical protein JXR76_17305 [Deltaproteobacteria bacterium]|nr:hypothetical protein [Deltaproteobacteria bacterium]